MSKDTIRMTGSVADRVKRIEQAVESLGIINCEACHDGNVAFVDRVVLTDVGVETPDCPADGPYDANAVCLTCGRARQRRSPLATSSTPPRVSTPCPYELKPISGPSAEIVSSEVASS